MNKNHGHDHCTVGVFAIQISSKFSHSPMNDSCYIGKGGKKHSCSLVHINCSYGLSVNINDCLQELRACPDGIHFRGCHSVITEVTVGMQLWWDLSH